MEFNLEEEDQCSWSQETKAEAEILQVLVSPFPNEEVRSPVFRAAPCFPAGCLSHSPGSLLGTLGVHCAKLLDQAVAK